MTEDEELWDALGKLSEHYQELAKKYEQECDEYWNNLPYDDQLKAFYSVCKRIYQGDIEEQRSYRGVLYDTFGFDLDAYAIGMECRYMDIHNEIVVEKDEPRT